MVHNLLIAAATTVAQLGMIWFTTNVFNYLMEKYFSDRWEKDRR